MCSVCLWNVPSSTVCGVEQMTDADPPVKRPALTTILLSNALSISFVIYRRRRQLKIASTSEGDSGDSDASHYTSPLGIETLRQFLPVSSRTQCGFTLFLGKSTDQLFFLFRKCKKCDAHCHFTSKNLLTFVFGTDSKNTFA